MKYSKKCLIFIVLALVLCPLLIRDGMCIDIILYNGKIITVDKEFSIAEAIAIKGDRIEKVGSSSGILPLAHPHTRKIDLNGKTVLPGLIDAHLHPIQASTSELFEEIPDIQTLQELLDYIESQTKMKEQGNWIFHPKFFPTRIIEMRQPTKEELDEITPNHPVFLNGSYTGMINSCALNLCGINIDNGHPGVLKDSQTGEPTGIIRASAFPLIKKYMPKHEISYEQELDALEEMLKRYNRVGFTSITDGAQSPAGIRRYLDLWSSERLPVRVCVNIRAPHYESRNQFAADLRQLGFYSRFGNEMVRIGPLKVHIDGGILTGTAYLRQPWGFKAKEIYGIEDPEYRGILNMKRGQLFDIVSIANELGWKMTAHVTGGGGVDMLLDAYENANKTEPIKNKRFSIIHGNFYTKEAIERCSKLGVIADFQPAWFYKDADAMKYILGNERIKTFL
ncbi:amidohydrolase family protein, partial [candidate division KSB1 bacterium]|nr:amidohydrolase family protein [candidate division KSB1 bacterium]